MTKRITIVIQNAMVREFTETGKLDNWAGWNDGDLVAELYRLFPDFLIAHVLEKIGLTDLSRHATGTAMDKLNRFDPVNYEAKY